jgi:hypothetical protein
MKNPGKINPEPKEKNDELLEDSNLNHLKKKSSQPKSNVTVKKKKNKSEEELIFEDLEDERSPYWE